MNQYFVVIAVSAKCFFQLRQLRVVQCSLDDESVATLVHAFVTSRIDYCNGLLAGSPKVVTDKPQHATNLAAHNCHEHAEIRPRFNACSTSYTSLVGCTTMCHIQALHDCLQVSARNGTDVSVGYVPAHCVGGWSLSLALSRPWTTHHTSLQSDDCWQKGIFVHSSVYVEQSSRMYAR